MATSLPLAPRPAHVPPELVVDFDVYMPMAPGDDDYFAPHIRLQKAGMPPIVWSPHNGGHWIVTKRDLMYRAFADYANFSSAKSVAPASTTPDDVKLYPISLDPPEHGRYRALFSSAFILPAVKKREGEVRDLARGLAEGVRSQGRCEFVADFAQYLPMKVFMGMVDLPDSDRLALIAMADTVVGPNSGSKSAAFGAIMDYIGRIVDQRLAQPGDDLVSKIATAEVEGRPVTRYEAVSVCSLLLIGGLDTVASMCGHIIHFLARHPAHRCRLVDDPALIPAATEEFLRRFALTNPGRVVPADQVYEGVRMKRGEMITFATPLAAVDPTIHKDAGAVQFDRRSPMSTTFGNGAHRCPGNMLARAEIRVILEEWLPRICDFRLDPDAPPVIRTGVNGSFTRLPLIWDVPA